ncbi:HipA domain protein [Treponema primitia ZAS-2]|uniref:HipA domain protein n=1 Tax=Treponema primitia (strain ATCC BAA-887 / DSM 12427 / ZAS-2) TaxID=545694 RepID=F5YRG7_TREPZ|nr:HipA domain-containing protein [Treponema primitia]AEF84650.1 HipA domain protein [Treponema primitia ZAS-2]
MGDIYAYLEMPGHTGPIQIGILHSDIVRGKEVFSFAGGDEWLLHREFQVLDPALGPFLGRQYPREGRPNFGLFMDSAPDRWGRMLIKRRESMAARLEGRAPRTLHETDFLLGVYDGSRMGALRLKLDRDGDFLDKHREAAIPPWASLRNLEYASLNLEREDSADEKDYMQWLNLLFKPGSSLGGARPKATAADRKGHLWIAKFPSVNDTKDTGAWERVVNELAADCGITVPESKAQRFSNRHHTFLAKRFDRSAEGKRLHFASAMTLLDRQDGDDHSAGASYLDIAGVIIRSGADINRNLEELWRRMVFNIAVSNCDDHLRNHGFLLSPAGWVLSPAYDMNPDENGTGLTLNITETDNALDFDLPMEVISYFRLREEKALAILAEVRHSVSNWRTLADKYGISKMQQDMTEAAFRA